MSVWLKSVLEEEQKNRPGGGTVHFVFVFQRFKSIIQVWDLTRIPGVWWGIWAPASLLSPCDFYFHSDLKDFESLLDQFDEDNKSLQRILVLVSLFCSLKYFWDPLITIFVALLWRYELKHSGYIVAVQQEKQHSLQKVLSDTSAFVCFAKTCQIMLLTMCKPNFLQPLL